jgi:hypothetical protein
MNGAPDPSTNDPPSTALAAPTTRYQAMTPRHRCYREDHRSFGEPTTEAQIYRRQQQDAMCVVEPSGLNDEGGGGPATNPCTARHKSTTNRIRLPRHATTT